MIRDVSEVTAEFRDLCYGRELLSKIIEND
jgi:hypothetical protein